MSVDASTDRSDALVERLFGATLGALEVFSVYLGAELGLYRAIERHGPVTAGELAGAAGIHPRYAREWLEQQATAGFLDVDLPLGDAEARRYGIAPDHARVLVHSDDLAHVAPFGHMIAGVGGVLPQVAEAYRTGEGVPYELYGRDFRHGQGHLNRPAFSLQLPTTWLAAMPDVVERLLAPGARVADIGCGQGWSTLAVAHAFRDAQVDGFDLDAASIADARRNAAEAGSGERVRFFEGAAERLAGEGRYDLALILEALHDMARPLEALQAARALLSPGGTVLLVDERVAEEFGAPGDEVERFMYGWSVTHCLPASMAEQPSAALGTVLRPGTVRDLAAEAGFARCEELPVENAFFRLYRLTP
jgi:ubiquinone/menaquinone biosynthesis C-methylase UbiE